MKLKPEFLFIKFSQEKVQGISAPSLKLLMNSNTNNFVKCASHKISKSRKLLKIKKGKRKNRF